MKLYICLFLFIFLVGLLIYYTNAAAINEPFAVDSIDPTVNQQNLDALLNNLPTMSQNFINSLDQIITPIKQLPQILPGIINSIKSSPGSLTITPNQPNSPPTTIDTIKITVNNMPINIKPNTQQLMDVLNMLINDYVNTINTNISNISAIDIRMGET